MVLHVTTTGRGPPLVILHGMLGQGRNWGQVARLLAPRLTVHALDLRNHGASPRAPTMDYPSLASDVADTLESLGLEDASVLGHSVGGKAGMVLALSRPRSVRCLVVVDIAPVTYRPHHRDLVRAMRSLDLSRLTRRADADAALAAGVPDPRTRAFLLQSLASGASGGYTWKTDLDALERSLGALSGFPRFEDDARYTGPVLMISGADSDYVRVEHTAEITRLFPRARHMRIPGAGHWVHADQPEALVAALESFLSGTEAQG